MAYRILFKTSASAAVTVPTGRVALGRRFGLQHWLDPRRLVLISENVVVSNLSSAPLPSSASSSPENAMV